MQQINPGYGMHDCALKILNHPGSFVKNPFCDCERSPAILSCSRRETSAVRLPQFSVFLANLLLSQ